MKCSLLFVPAGILLVSAFTSCTLGPTLSDGAAITTAAGNGPKIKLDFARGDSWMSGAKIGFLKLRITPQIVVWAEDGAGAVTTLFATRCFGKQEWKMAKFDPDSCGRPTCAPYWLGRLKANKLSPPTKNHPLPDAVTGATPRGSFTLVTSLPAGLTKFTLFIEISKSFDFNEGWPEKTGPTPFNGQPAVIYRGAIDLSDTAAKSWTLAAAGMSGDRGDDPVLYPLSPKLTTALSVVKSIMVTRP